ncbi:hypothetical protein A4A49_37387 [Nicotiana attenuata]|uniref:Retrovirus-related pol polyprotein from transposon tnt 1-94 n=1 Tax=Nicotiana attenuata TaxID=49451 RepID=A0A1J6JS88_NICAT|nr:hypothetical protein A4A49_37387 [Nicotiana attenuata]
MSVISLHEILETNKLIGPNFDGWYRNLRIVLMHEKLIDVIDKTAKIIPPKNDVQGTKVYQKHLEECLTIKHIILASMSSELQRKHQNMDPTAIIEYLKKMVDAQLDIENSPVGPLVNHMTVLTEEHEKLGYKLGKELSKDLILQSVYNAECFHYKKKGHWKGNCKEYFATLKDKKQSETLMKNVFKVSLATTNSSLWVLDTGSGYDIYKMLQGFKISRRLKKGEVNLQVGNGAKVAAVAIGSISLIIPTSKVLMLDDCYYVPKFVSNIISAYMLDKRGFCINIENGIFSIYYGDNLYVNGHLQHDVYVLPNVNANSIMHVSSLKRKRDDQVNHTYLWHCRLGQIGEKRINKLYKEGYLDKFIGYPKETMGYCFYHPSGHKVFVARGATFLERKFLLEGNYNGEIELDEVQETNESTQCKDHETQVEEPLLDVLKLPRKLPSSTVEVQELNEVQEQVNEPVPNQIEQQPNPAQGEPVVQVPLRRSTRERHVPTRLNLIVQDDVSNEFDHNDDDPKTYEEAIQSSD